MDGRIQIPARARQCSFGTLTKSAGSALQFQPEGCSFRLEEPFLIELRLRTVATESGLNLPATDAECQVEASREADPAVCSAFEALARGDMPGGYSPPAYMTRPSPPDAGGNPTRWAPMVVYMPGAVREFMTEVDREIDKATRRVLDLLRWMFRREGLVVNRIPNRSEFSLDKNEWHKMPSMIDPEAALLVASIDYIPFGDAEASAVKAAIADRESEPLAHALLREALQLRFEQPKSSLLIGFTAAEAGVKHHIVRIWPRTANLVMDLPSPPIVKLLDFIDDLDGHAPALGPGNKIPRSIRKSLDEMSRLRNKIIHTGEHDPDPKKEKLTMQSLHAKLEDVRDLLWILDYYAGHKWAREYISRDRLEELAKLERKQGRS